MRHRPPGGLPKRVYPTEFQDLDLQRAISARLFNAKRGKPFTISQSIWEALSPEGKERLSEDVQLTNAYKTHHNV